jgi:(S)-sulfolactate dehydrogenase
MARIVITEFMDEGAVDRLAAEADVLYDPTLADDRDRLLEVVADADGLIVRNRTRVDATLLAAAPVLAVVGRLGVGLDNIDLDACAARSVLVKPATGANALAVAEYVIASVMSLIRGSFFATPAVIEGRWPRTEATGLEVRGRTLGLVGYGAIARIVADLARGLGMDVVAHDPYVDASDPAWGTTRSVTLDELLTVSDAISLHVPLTDGTRALIGRDQIAMMKPTAVLVNTARGGIVDELALIRALDTGAIRGAALDVFVNEPVRAEDGGMFENVPNLLLTPHVAGITEESNRRVSDMIASEVMSVLADGTT